MSVWRTIAAVPRQGCTLDTLVRIALGLGYEPAGVRIYGWHEHEGTTWFHLQADHNPDQGQPVIVPVHEVDEEPSDFVIPQGAYAEISTSNGHDPASDEETDLPYPCEHEGCTRRFASTRGMRRHLASHPTDHHDRRVCQVTGCLTLLSRYNCSDYCATHDPARISTEP